MSWVGWWVVEIFQQKHVISTWNGQINGYSHVYKMIE